ncbi:hypothetical protein JHK85_006231 [Glycine max]|nr:hypothetical protein JHK85_006231 [Glycine max]
MDGDDETSGPMIDEIYANGGGDDGDKRSRRAIMSGDQVDIEAYAALYSGRTKIMRLLFIADKMNNAASQLEALRMAYDEIKKGENTQLFREVVQKIDGRLGPNYGMDAAWCDAIDRRAEQKKEKLENELNAYRTNLIKESIRMGYNDFGEFYYAHGQLGDAFKSYVRTRDYCTTSKHIVHMCMSAILVSIEMGQFPHVTSYVSKAEQSPDALEAVTVAKLRCAAGLANLEAKKYKLAARKAQRCELDVGSFLGVNCKRIACIIPESHELPVVFELCVSGAATDEAGHVPKTGLGHARTNCVTAVRCMVASRQKWLRFVAESRWPCGLVGAISFSALTSLLVFAALQSLKELGFQETNWAMWPKPFFLETGPELGSHYNDVIAPQDVATYGGLCALATFDRAELKASSPLYCCDGSSFQSETLMAFHYASCLEYLGNLKANLLLDIHLHDHVETLYDQIRHKALIQYTLPFVSVDLNMMANAFKTTVAGLEKELEALITDNQIQARIDSHNKILYARHADQRNATFQRVLETGREFDRDVRSMLLRSNLIKHEFNLRALRKL